jgi:hypothetical protein
MNQRPTSNRRRFIGCAAVGLSGAALAPNAEAADTPHYAVTPPSLPSLPIVGSRERFPVHGALLYPQTKAEQAVSLTPVNSYYPGPGQADTVHVFRYLSVFQINDVVTYGFSFDLAAPIQSAIDMLNNWSVYTSALGQKGSAGYDYNRGGILYLPGGGYLLSTTLLGAPNVVLRGAVPLRNSMWETITPNASSGGIITILKAQASSFPANQYVVDSGTWRRVNEDGSTVTTPYRSVLATDQFLAAASGGVDSNAFIVGFQLENLAIDGSNVAFGGRRQQCGASFRDDSISVYNTLYCGLAYTQCFEFELGPSTIAAPIPLYCSALESMMGDKGEWQHYSEASSAWVSGNQSLINSVFYANAYGGEPGNWGGLTLKCAIFQWCANVTIGFYAGNAGNVGIEAYKSNVKVLHWENEFTADGTYPGALILARGGSTVTCYGPSSKATCALASGDSTSKVIIHQPCFLACPSSFTPLTTETSSTFLVELWDMPIVDQVLGSQMRISNVNLSRLFNPQVNGTNYTGTLTLYCDSSTGSATLDGLLASHPTTIDGALQFIANNSHIPQFIVSLAGSETHTIANAHSFTDQYISMGVTSGSTTLAVHSSISLASCYFGIGTVTITCNQAQIFICKGITTVDIPGCTITIPASSVIFACAANTTARLMVTGLLTTINFGSSSGLCSGGATPGYINYEDALASCTTSGTPALEGITSGKVKKIASLIV